MSKCTGTLHRNINKTHICKNLGFFPGISSCEHQNLDMMKSLSCLLLIALQLADVLVKKNLELLPDC